MDPDGSGSATESYAILAQVVKGFLDAYLRRETGAEERFLARVEDPSMKGIMRTEWSTPSVPPAK